MAAAPLLPPPFVDLAPASWPGLVLYVAVVLLEAEGEPEPGPLAVAWVVRNRVDAHPRLAHDPEAELLGAVLLAPQQFSCLNPDYAGMRRARLTGVDPRAWETCWRAASAAWWRLLPDPTGGARHYLNPALTRQIRPHHDLPAWYDPARVTAIIGHHEFLLLA